MNRLPWEISPLQSDELVAKTVSVFKVIHARHFADDPAVNLALPIVARAFRHDGVWRLFLLLTPWMLGRLFFPQNDPGLVLPKGWGAASRTADVEFSLLGPSLSFQMHGEGLKAHIHYQPELGHFMIQPLAMNMDRFKSEEAAFDSWSAVIRKRDEMMVEKKKKCGWQAELSRREVFSGLFSSARE